MIRSFGLVSLLLNHPMAKNNRTATVQRFLRWQIGSKIMKQPIVIPFVDNTRLVVRKGMTGATGNIYYGLMEYEDMSFVLHFLRPYDLFGDIGANVGVYTILASGAAGARSISLEPLPAAAAALRDNIGLNMVGDRVTVKRMGVGASKETLRFSVDLDTMNHVITAADGDMTYEEVPVETMDTIFADEVPILLKIDVEGFEAQVLEGGKQVLADPRLEAIIIELNGSGKRYGISDDQIHCVLTDAGFTPHRYSPAEREIMPLAKYGDKNTLYLKNPSMVQDRVHGARSFRVLNQQI